MSDTVFILGAGASQAAGAPLMDNFLDVAEGLRKRGQVGNAAEAFKLVFDGLAALQQAQSKAAVNLENVESVFAAFEMARLLGRLGNLSSEQIEQLPLAMRRVIETTIEATVQFPVSEDHKITPPVPYSHLVRLVQEAISGSKSTPPTPVLSHLLRTFSVITFNYDLCVDYAFDYRGIPVRYCLDPQESKDSLAVLKLHGSLNWGRCSACQRTVYWPLARFFLNRRFDLEGVASITLPLGSQMSEFKHCSSGTVDGPYVVPPTWNKSQYHESLETVWQAAASELSTAENIFVCGYSLPDTDQFFKYLYALGTIGETRLKRLWVFNPNKKVEDNFRSLLGQAVVSRFRFFDKTFEQMFYEIRPLFGLTTN